MLSSNCNGIAEITYFYLMLTFGLSAILSLLLFSVFDKADTSKISGSSIFGVFYYIFSSKGLSQKGQVWRMWLLISWGGVLGLFILGKLLDFCSSQ